MSSRMLIGALADATHVGVETLRFYEREGLLPEPPRTDAGYRLYDDHSVRRVRFIRRARELGFTLAEISELLALRVAEGDCCDEVAERTREKIRSVEDRIRELEAIRRVLEELVQSCTAEEHTDDCPILDALDESAPIHRRGEPHHD